MTGKSEIARLVVFARMWRVGHELGHVPQVAVEDLGSIEFDKDLVTKTIVHFTKKSRG